MSDKRTGKKPKAEHQPKTTDAVAAADQPGDTKHPAKGADARVSH